MWAFTERFGDRYKSLVRSLASSFVLRHIYERQADIQIFKILLMSTFMCIIYNSFICIITCLEAIIVMKGSVRSPASMQWSHSLLSFSAVKLQSHLKQSPWPVVNSYYNLSVIKRHEDVGSVTSHRTHEVVWQSSTFLRHVWVSSFRPTTSVRSPTTQVTHFFRSHVARWYFSANLQTSHVRNQICDCLESPPVVQSNSEV